MTWVSLRSGIASSGTVRIDQMPATTATVTSRNTTKRFRAENSMMASITAVTLMRHARRRVRGLLMRVLGSAHPGRRRLELAFRVDEECPRRHYALAGGKTSNSRHAISEAFADGDLARLEITVPEIDK